jgi:rubredoxin
MKELVRCRPCGFVIEADKLGDVCPACGLPRKVFEPYREKVSRNRLILLGIDMHPIAIHLSQTFVILIPVLILFTKVFPNFYFDMFSNVLQFSLFVFPFTLIIAIITGVVDGLTRFKSLKPPLLRIKIIFSGIILIVAFAQLIISKTDNFGIVTTILSLISLACAVRLGLWGKKLIDVILPGTYPQKKGARIKEKEAESK